MEENKIIKENDKLNYVDYKKASEPFMRTKRELISSICAYGRDHKILKYPILIGAVIFIFFANIAFYIALFYLTKKKQFWIAVASVIFVTFFSIIIAISIKQNDNNGAEQFYTALNQEYVSVTKVKRGTVSWYNLVNVDMDRLERYNEDIIGWIYFENVNISYPILKGNDNEHYAKYMLDGTESMSGSIYIDFENSEDFNDQHTILYGHNMENGLMFAKLQNYVVDPTYVENHAYFQIITDEHQYRYQITKDMSKVENEYWITLSTCETDDEGFALSAQRVGER